MPEEQSARELWANIYEKTVLDGEKLAKFKTPADAAVHYVPQLSRGSLVSWNTAFGLKH